MATALADSDSMVFTCRLSSSDKAGCRHRKGKAGGAEAGLPLGPGRGRRSHAQWGRKQEETGLSAFTDLLLPIFHESHFLETRI